MPALHYFLTTLVLATIGCTTTLAREPSLAHDLPIPIAEAGLDGRTIVVSPAGSDDAAGDEADPLKTLQAAADRVEPGDTVLVRAGVYHGADDEIPLRIMRGGTADNWVKFTAFPGETPIIDTDAIRGIQIEGADYVVVEGFTIRGKAKDIDPAAATAHAEAFKGEDHSQSQFFTVGIRVSTGDEDRSDFAHHVIIRGNTIHDVPGGGIATARADYLLIENNHVYRTSFYTPWGGSGISVWQSANHDDADDVYRTVVRNNVSHHNNNRVKFWMMEDFTDGNGIIIDALQNTQGELLDDDQTEPYNGRILVANNLCYANGGRGINLYESDNIDILHNTLHHNAQRENIKQEIEFGRTNHVVVAHNIIVPADGLHAFGGYQSDDLHFAANLIHNATLNNGWPLGDGVIDADPKLGADLTPAADSPAHTAATARFDFATRTLIDGAEPHAIGADVPAIVADTSGAFIVEDLGKHYAADSAGTPPALMHHVADDDVIHGNTSFRNESADTLAWKGKESSNGFGYFQRNRDLGQVFNIPPGEPVTIDALVLRTSLGNNAVMAGAPGAELLVQFYKVDAQSLAIDEYGTPKGTRAKHGFDHQFNRADDQILGPKYTPIATMRGGVFPESVPPTTMRAHPDPRGPSEMQPGHLRYFRIDFADDAELTLEPGRYAFMVGFAEPGTDRGIALAIDTEVHTKEQAVFVVDANGLIRWGIRREGDGTLPPTMTGDRDQPTDAADVAKLKAESLFAEDRTESLAPVSKGYPDVDTYRTLQFYIETRGAN